MAYLIINADDFTQTDGVARGIVECRTSGLPLSTTAGMCFAGAAARIAEFAPQFGDDIGVHLQLTHGRPVLPPDSIPSLVRPGGLLPDRPGEIRPAAAEVAREWRAQVASLAGCGIRPDHLDSHHNVHMRATRQQPVLKVYAELALELGMPARGGNALVTRYLQARGVVCADQLIYFRNMETLFAELAALRSEQDRNRVVELCCHPGYADAALSALVLNPKAVATRDDERRALSAAEWRERLAREGWEIIRYRDLKDLPRGKPKGGRCGRLFGMWLRLRAA